MDNKILLLMLCAFVAGFIITLIINYFITSRKDSKIGKLNSQISELEDYINERQKDSISLTNLINELSKHYNTLTTEYSNLTGRRDELNVAINNLEQYSKDFYKTNLDLATERLNASLERAALQYQAEEEKYKSDYLDTMKDFVDEFTTEFAKQDAELKALSAKLKELRAKTAAAVEQSKRNLEEKDKQNYYRLQVPKEDTSEIKMLREVIPYLRDKEALNKVIWKVYYEKPYTDLIGRVVPTKKTGIYKITNITNNMCYVGQAVDIADRWKTHIKRGLGAEPGGRNKLYPVMYELGPENFTFEVIEVCDRDQLNEREDFWQDYFKAKEFGYSIK